nr:amidohydrolase family protein [Roseimicrobium gellanilyticum]
MKLPFSMAPFIRHISRLSLLMAISAAAQAPPSPPAQAPASVTLFSNVRIFDGKSGELSAPSHVLVRGNKIEKISASPIPTDRRGDTVLIDGGGRTLMPGLIDAHVHLMLESVPLQVALMSEINYLSLVAGKAAEKQLLRGFTTVRDMGGASFALKRAIDEGVIPGPRIYPSGATISQTSGHGDFRLPPLVPRERGAPLTYPESTGMTAIADGVDEVLLRTRENLMRGATQIKVMAGGGVSSNYDPLDVTQYTLEEMQAAVRAAENWGTYVSVHAYTPHAIQLAIQAGVKCIEHGQLVDEETAKLMAAKGIWWSLQPFLDDPDATRFKEGSPNHLKQLMVTRGTDRAYELAKKHKIQTAFGTDTLFDAKLAPRQGAQLTKLTRWYQPAEILKMATSDNASLLATCGLRNPYPGKLGVVEEGALADLLLVDGDPIIDIKLVEDPEKNFLVIMKDGKVYKNALRP